jgi:hypothetical protein
MKLSKYEYKYIKYKSKYLENKNIIQKGGMDCKNDRTFKNIVLVMLLKMILKKY